MIVPLLDPFAVAVAVVVVVAAVVAAAAAAAAAAGGGGAFGSTACIDAPLGPVGYLSWLSLVATSVHGSLSSFFCRFLSGIGFTLEYRDDDRSSTRTYSSYSTVVL